MDELEAQLRQLVTDACQHPPGSPHRQRNLTRIIRIVSRKLWRESTAYYADALQQTWVYFCKHLCESYDPKLSSIPTWLNAYLRRRLQDFYIEEQKKQRERATSYASQSRSGETGDLIDPLDSVPAQPDVPPILETVRAWAEADADGELTKTHIKGHPEANCQVLILKRLPPETSWDALSKEFGIAIPTLSAFYQRQCMTRLRKFGEAEGYL